MSDNLLINREVELDKLLNNLANTGDPVKFFSIVGQKGYGKTTLIHQLWGLLKEIDTPFVFLNPQGIGREWFDKWPILLTQAIQVNKDELVSLKEQVNSKLETIYETSSQEEQTSYPFDFKGPASKASLDQCQKWVRLLIKGIYKAYDDYEQKRGTELKLIIVLDDYDDFSPDYRQFFYYSFVKAIEELDPDLDVRYIVSSKLPLANTTEIEKDWPGLWSNNCEVKLEPFSKRDMLFYLNYKEIPSKFLDPIYEVCQGVPGKFEEAIEKIVGSPKDKNAQKSLNEIENLFEGKTETQKKWLLWAGYLRKVTVEGLQLFRCPDEVLDAFSWLRTQKELKLTENNGGFDVEEAVAEGIVNWYLSSNLKDKYSDYAHMVAVYNEVLQFIPQLEARERLADLSHFSHFNMDLVKIIFSKQEKEVTRFIERDNDQYLMKKRFTIAIKPEFQDAVKTYLDLFPHKQRKDLFAKIGDLWKARSEELKKRVEEVEEKLKKSNAERDKNEKEIAIVMQEIKKQEDLMKQYTTPPRGAKKETTNSFVRPKGSPSVYIFLLIAFGVLLLYFGVIFSENFSVVPVALGTAFVIGGVIWASDAATKPGSSSKTGKMTAKENALKSKIANVLKIQKARKEDLEKKRSAETYNLTKYKNQREELDAELNEAYII